MANRNPKPSGLNIEDMMDDIDKQESIQYETANLDAKLRQIQDAIRRQEELSNQLTRQTGEMKSASEQMKEFAEKAEEILTEINAAIDEAKSTSITVVVSDKSVATINSLHKQFIDEEKAVISEMEICRKLQMDRFRCDFSNAINSKGFWCSSKTFLWLGVIFFFSVAVIIIELTVWIYTSFHH
ncbi:MAG: hypothetical protein J1F40_10540 [Prevotellaceae bacterium]|nr:hypothetical protein [Prevotellaceae bacterium]